MKLLSLSLLVFASLSFASNIVPGDAKSMLSGVLAELQADVDTVSSFLDKSNKCGIIFCSELSQDQKMQAVEQVLISMERLANLDKDFVGLSSVAKKSGEVFSSNFMTSTKLNDNQKKTLNSSFLEQLQKLELGVSFQINEVKRDYEWLKSHMSVLMTELKSEAKTDEDKVVALTNIKNASLMAKQNIARIDRILKSLESEETEMGKFFSAQFDSLLKIQFQALMDGAESCVAGDPIVLNSPDVEKYLPKVTNSSGKALKVICAKKQFWNSDTPSFNEFDFSVSVTYRSEKGSGDFGTPRTVVYYPTVKSVLNAIP